MFFIPLPNQKKVYTVDQNNLREATKNTSSQPAKERERERQTEDTLRKNKTIPAELLKPNLLQPKYIIKIKVFKSRCCINFGLRFIGCTAKGRAF